MWLLSTRTITNEVAKHNNKDKIRLLSTRTTKMRLLRTTTKANKVAKYKNKGK